MQNDEKQRRTLHPISWVVIAIGLIAVVIALALPSFMQDSYTSAQQACINNLRQIERGKELWKMKAAVTNTP